MGCNTSRIELRPEEARFYNGEQFLLYSSHDVIEIDITHHKYSFNGFINEKQ